MTVCHYWRTRTGLGPVVSRHTPGGYIYIYSLHPRPGPFCMVQELCESRGGRAVRPNEPSGFRGRKAILNHALALVSACP